MVRSRGLDRLLPRGRGGVSPARVEITNCASCRQKNIKLTIKQIADIAQTKRSRFYTNIKKFPVIREIDPGLAGALLKKFQIYTTVWSEPYQTWIYGLSAGYWFDPAVVDFTQFSASLQIPFGNIFFSQSSAPYLPSLNMCRSWFIYLFFSKETIINSRSFRSGVLLLS